MSNGLPFETLPLIRSIIVLDTATGSLVVHEVRRDPTTGLTLTRARAIEPTT